jgi:hypothetical protein
VYTKHTIHAGQYIHGHQRSCPGRCKLATFRGFAVLLSFWSERILRSLLSSPALTICHFGFRRRPRFRSP